MLSLSIHHIIFVECFHPCIVLQISIGIFLIGDMRMLQVFLYHHQILPSQPTQYILATNILTDIVLPFLVYLKFSSNMSGTLQYDNSLKLSFDCFIMWIVFNTTSCIEMDSFSATSKAVILVAIYIVLCLQNKTFAGKI